AAAVAAGLLPIGAAADGGGSTRIPAAFNHLFGYKPTFESIPNFYKPFDPIGLAIMGSVTHTVRDAAVYLDGLCGRPGRHALPGSFAAACDRPPPKGLKVGLCLSSPLLEVQPDIAERVKSVAELLEQMGHHVYLHDTAPEGGLDRFLPVYGRVMAATPVLTP
ncbi:MAG TPA: amidase, partial [Myxococcales bacterium]|nr:amidase [Myxococcales bacterium]